MSHKRIVIAALMHKIQARIQGKIYEWEQTPTSNICCPVYQSVSDFPYAPHEKMCASFIAHRFFLHSGDKMFSILNNWKKSSVYVLDKALGGLYLSICFSVCLWNVPSLVTLKQHRFIYQSLKHPDGCESGSCKTFTSFYAILFRLWGFTHKVERL